MSRLCHQTVLFSVCAQTLSGVLATAYFCIVWHVLQDHWPSALQYLCTWTWIGLGLYLSAFAVRPDSLHHPFFRALGQGVYGGAGTMLAMVLRFWPDRFSNPTHLFAHYTPALLMNQILRVQTPASLTGIVWWPMFYYMCTRTRARDLYGIDFGTNLDELSMVILVFTLPFTLPRR